MKIFILLITFYSSISFGACVPGNIACQNAEIQYFKGQTAPYATPSAGFANLYFDSSVSNGVTPRWQDSLATVYPIIGKITSNRTIYVATTGNDTTGTGLIGAPYLTPQKALDYLSNFMLAPGVEVLISVAAGQYILTSSIVPQHPQGAQITIQGATVATPPVAADFCTPAGAPNPTAAARETCANTDLTMLRTKFPTELRFNANVDGILVKGAYIKIANFLISSLYLPNTASTANQKRGIIAGYDSAIPDYRNSGNIRGLGPISVHGFGSHAFAAYISSSIVNNGTATASNNGNYGFISAISSSIVNNGTATASNNGNYGFSSATSSSIVNNGTATASNNGNYGFSSAISSSINNAGTATASNNGSVGFYSVTSSSINNAGTATASNNGSVGFSSAISSSIVNNGTATASNNGSVGFSSATSSSIVNNGTATASNNGSYGFSSAISSSINNAGTVNATGNLGIGVYADNKGFVGITTIGTIQSYTPALNTLGNADALIQDI